MRNAGRGEGQTGWESAEVSSFLIAVQARPLAALAGAPFSQCKVGMMEFMRRDRRRAEEARLPGRTACPGALVKGQTPTGSEESQMPGRCDILGKGSGATGWDKQSKQRALTLIHGLASEQEVLNRESLGRHGARQYLGTIRKKKRRSPCGTRRHYWEIAR